MFRVVLWTVAIAVVVVVVVEGIRALT
jgi:hypothetical protein